ELMAHLLLPGAEGDYASVPDPGPITELDVRAYITPDAWDTPQFILSQWPAGGVSGLTFYCEIGVADLPRFSTSVSDGTSTYTLSMSVNHAFVGGVGRWVRFTL